MASTVEIFERIDDVRDSETATKFSDYTKSSGSSAENGKLCCGETFIGSVIKKKSANFTSSNSNQKQQQISFDNERTQATEHTLERELRKKNQFLFFLSIPSLHFVLAKLSQVPSSSLQYTSSALRLINRHD